MNRENSSNYFRWLAESMKIAFIPNKTVRLSERELEVLKLIVEGYSNPEIAAKLYVSPNTVKTHVRSLMNKLGADHRIQLAVIALRNGIIE